MMFPLKLRIFVATAAVGLVLDQATKVWVRANIAERSPGIEVIPGLFSIVHAENTAAAFNLFEGFAYRQVVFLVFAVIAFGVIADLVRKLAPTERFMSFVLGLILSGALGNAIDRATRGSVTDFFRVYVGEPTMRAWLVERFGTSDWPAFNVADTALVVGVLLFLVHYLFAEEEAPAGASAAKAP